jgi:hypothetical protein
VPYDDDTQRQFDPETISVVRDDEGASDFTDDQLKRLCGAPAGSTIHVGAIDSTGIYLVATGPALDGRMIRLIGIDENDELFIRNERFRLTAEAQGQGFGGRALAIQAHQAAQLGFVKLTAFAAGDHGTLNSDNASQRWSGYLVWLRLGYDGPIPMDQLIARGSMPPHHLRGAERLSELMVSDEGKEFWLEHGFGVEVEFDLTQGSNSWTILRRHTQRKGIKVDL